MEKEILLRNHHRINYFSSKQEGIPHSSPKSTLQENPNIPLKHNLGIPKFRQIRNSLHKLVGWGSGVCSRDMLENSSKNPTAGEPHVEHPWQLLQDIRPQGPHFGAPEKSLQLNDPSRRFGPQKKDGRFVACV